MHHVLDDRALVLLCHGDLIEPVVAYGPFVMNSKRRFERRTWNTSPDNSGKSGTDLRSWHPPMPRFYLRDGPFCQSGIADAGVDLVLLFMTSGVTDQGLVQRFPAEHQELGLFQRETA